MQQNEALRLRALTLPLATHDPVSRYRQRAQECWARAMRAHEPAMIAGWLDLAASWNDLTEQADHRRLSDGTREAAAPS